MTNEEIYTWTLTIKHSNKEKLEKISKSIMTFYHFELPWRDDIGIPELNSKDIIDIKLSEKFD
jgi:hypothetical protein